MTTEQLYKRLIDYITIMSIATIFSFGIVEMIGNYHIIKEIQKVQKVVEHDSIRSK